jgi:alpha-N-arabinofuranosidase
VGGSPAIAQQARIEVDAGKPGHAIAKSMYGIFFEPLNHAADGGLYAELLRNRSFEESLPPEGMKLVGEEVVVETAVHYVKGTPKTWKREWKPANDHESWTLEGDTGGGSLKVGSALPVHPANVRYLTMTVGSPSTARLINTGYWGIGVKEGESYNLSLMARRPQPVKLTAGLIAADGSILGQQTIDIQEAGAWRKFTATIKATRSDPRARFFIALSEAGAIDLDVISLFPAATFKNRPNGLRADIAQLLADMKPAFLRFPGGCFVEGATFANRVIWKNTIGPIEHRPGHWGLWGYRSTDGLGYHEYLQLCEDIGADALYVVNAGMGCDFKGADCIPEHQVGELIQDTMDAIEYAIGPADSTWGRLRAEAGHPEPFPLRYIQIGNENHGERYKANYKQFYEALKKRYPQLSYILCCGTGWAKPEMIQGAGKVEIADEHFYRDANWFFQEHGRYDSTPRDRGFDVYVGEYACNKNVGQGNMLAALSEAAFMLGMERNSDVVKMTSYAPLLFNVNRLDWPVNMIGYDSATVFGRSSYYVQKLFATNLPDVNLATKMHHTPGAPEHTRVYAQSGYDKAAGQVIIKVVNATPERVATEVVITGGKVSGTGKKIVLAAEKPELENDVAAPTRIAPMESPLSADAGSGTVKLDLEPWSMTVIRLPMK